MPTSIGIATTKTLSKIANHIAKKEKSGVVSLVDKKDIDPILEKININDIWGVGKQLTKFYIKNGINNAKQLKNVSNTWIKKSSNVLGSRTAMELRGISCIDLEIHHTKRKSCCVSRSFGKKIKSLKDITEAVSAYITRAAEKIRNEKLVSNNINLYIRTNPFNKNPKEYYANSISISLDYPTNDTITLNKKTLIGLNKIFRKGYLYQKAGVILSGLEAENKDFHLFKEDNERKKTLMSAFDYINQRYGKNSLHIASEGIEKRWLMKRSRCSSNFTTSLKDLLIVKC